MTKRFALIAVTALAVACLAVQCGGDKKKDPARKEEKKTVDLAGAQETYKQNCAVCHFADKPEKRFGPSLKGLFHRDKLFDGRPVKEENVRDLILNGTAKMIPFKKKLDKKQVEELIGYLKTL